MWLDFLWYWGESIISIIFLQARLYSQLVREGVGDRRDGGRGCQSPFCYSVGLHQVTEAHFPLRCEEVVSLASEMRIIVHFLACYFPAQWGGVAITHSPLSSWRIRSLHDLFCGWLEGSHGLLSISVGARESTQSAQWLSEGEKCRLAKTDRAGWLSLKKANDDGKVETLKRDFLVLRADDNCNGEVNHWAQNDCIFYCNGE